MSESIQNDSRVSRNDGRYKESVPPTAPTRTKRASTANPTEQISDINRDYKNKSEYSRKPTVEHSGGTRSRGQAYSNRSQDPAFVDRNVSPRYDAHAKPADNFKQSEKEYTKRHSRDIRYSEQYGSNNNENKHYHRNADKSEYKPENRKSYNQPATLDHQEKQSSYHSEKADERGSGTNQVSTWAPRDQIDDKPTEEKVASWQPRANRNNNDDRMYTSQSSLTYYDGSGLSLSVQNIAKAESMQELPTTKNSQGKTIPPQNSQSASQHEVQLQHQQQNQQNQVNRKYQRNSSYKPQHNRHSQNLGSVPSGSTHSLNIVTNQPQGYMNRGLSVSSVSLNPSAATSASGLAGQADLGLSSSRLSLASVSISRNPSLASLVTSNPSLYRTVSALSLYETGTIKPNTYLPITIAGCVLCPPIGVIGILFSVLAKDAIDAKDYPGAVRWGSVALWCGVAFIIGGIVMIITLSLILGLYHS